jgi:hypothetical protein
VQQGCRCPLSHHSPLTLSATVTLHNPNLSPSVPHAHTPGSGMGWEQLTGLRAFAAPGMSMAYSSKRDPRVGASHQLV